MFSANMEDDNLTSKESTKESTIESTIESSIEPSIEPETDILETRLCKQRSGMED